MTAFDPATNMEQALANANQTLRVFDRSVVHQLDRECWLSIEVNGIAVARLCCMDSALAELAAGWAFMHRYCEQPQAFDRVHTDGERASVMVRGGVDIERIRAAMVGETRIHLPVPTPLPRSEPWTIPDDVLLDILREAWQLFRQDRMLEGSIHAALASASGVEVVAFDLTADAAVAKVLGWCLTSGISPAHELLIVNGPVTRVMVEAATRLGVLLIATPHVPTADAFLAAQVVGMNIVGYMRQATAGLFGSPRLVTFDRD